MLASVARKETASLELRVKEDGKILQPAVDGKFVDIDFRSSGTGQYVANSSAHLCSATSSSGTMRMIRIHPEIARFSGRALIALGRLCVFTLCALSHAPAFEERHLETEEIIRKSVAANQLDFKAAVDFNWKERDSSGKGSKTYQVTMIEGTPYNRLLAVNGKPLSTAKEAEELRKQQEAAAQRRVESPTDRQKRIAKFEKERTRDNLMMEQLTQAFTFSLIGQRKVRGFKVWMLKATPRPGYQPPNVETQVLPGMQGQLWVDQETYNWVKVTAEVIRPVSIEGFLAQVQPGTRFEIEKSPVGNGIWQISHFSMKSSARILRVFPRSSSEDDTYSDYKLNR